MGQEPWHNHVLAIDQSGSHLGISESDAFLAHCRTRGITGERLYGSKKSCSRRAERKGGGPGLARQHLST